MKKTFEIILGANFLEGKSEEELSKFIQEQVAPYAASYFVDNFRLEAGCGTTTITIKLPDGTTITEEKSGCYIKA